MSKLVKHVRDDFGTPFATLVAIGRDQVGLSICNTRDRFDKKRGTLIAEKRAEQGVFPAIPRQSMIYSGDILMVDEVLAKEYAYMVQRSRRYYK